MGSVQKKMPWCDLFLKPSLSTVFQVTWIGQGITLLNFSFFLTSTSAYFIAYYLFINSFFCYKETNKLKKEFTLLLTTDQLKSPAVLYRSQWADRTEDIMVCSSVLISLWCYHMEGVWITAISLNGISHYFLGMRLDQSWLQRFAFHSLSSHSHSCALLLQTINCSRTAKFTAKLIY